MEENVNSVYYDFLIKKSIGEIEEIEMQDLVDELIAKGYQIEEKNAIDEVVVDSNIIIATKGTGILQLTYQDSLSTDYYIVIDGRYFKMTLDSTGVTIDRTEVKIKDGECVGDLEISVASGTSVTVGNITENSVTLNAGAKEGVSVLKVKYGNSTKECTVSVIKKPLIEQANAEVDINTDYGLVDVIWLSGTTNEYSETPNEPYLYNDLPENQRLTPVTWTYYKNGTTVNNKTVNWVEDETAKSNWYDYNAAKGNDGKEDNTVSMWANAKNKDGSYFVWIPRYAYRITYYSDATYTNVTGYYDGYGMWEPEEGKKKYDLDEGIETVEHNGKSYIVHPAFMEDTDKTDSLGNPLEDFARGGWDKDQTGIWVAKYEMSRQGAKPDDAGEGIDTEFLSVPGVRGAGNIAIGYMYQIGRGYDSDKESHMIKNSEWGVATYLTQSQYGRNGHEINVNNSDLTGNGEGTVSETGETETYEYNTILGAKSSSTGNIYGIYDMSGGKWEHVAAFDRLGGRLTYRKDVNLGTIILKDVTDSSGKYISTKYLTAYTNGSDDKSSVSKIFEVGKIGDATKEVRARSQSTNWFFDNSIFIISNAPYLGRGGGAGEGIYNGIFYSDSTYGQPLEGVTFRVVLGQ